MNLNRLLPLSAAPLFTGAFAAAPHFEDYPAAVYDGPKAEIRIAAPKSRQFASELRDAARRQPDFAGRYVLASWGCGASCVMAAAIDAKTGAVAGYRSPFAVGTST